MTSSHRIQAAALFAILLLAGCKRGEPAGAKASVAKPAASPNPAPTPSAMVAQARDTPAPKVAPCRALRVDGDVRAEQGRTLLTLDALEGRTWLELGDHAELVVRHAASAREFSVTGPARVLPCKNGLEQVLLARGKFHSSKGTGARPGAEVWVATPFGVLRYGDADLEVSTTPRELEVRARAGQVFAEAAEGLAGAAPDGALKPGSLGSKRGRLDAEALIRACEKAAALARTSAERVIDAASTDVGRLTAGQMRDRRDARARCLKAEAALATLDSPEQKARLGDLLQHADATWRGVPRGKGAASPEPTFRGPE